MNNMMSCNSQLNKTISFCVLLIRNAFVVSCNVRGLKHCSERLMMNILKLRLILRNNTVIIKNR